MKKHPADSRCSMRRRAVEHSRGGKSKEGRQAKMREAGERRDEGISIDPGSHFVTTQR
jgi:hypothetical protein